jgi:two-component system, cell cycle response regulator
VRVLIAEDDPGSRYKLEVSLQRWGYEVLVARDGAQAWALLQEEHAPTLAVLDWMMPGLDGLEICRRVRNRPSRPYVYILLLTAKGRKEDLVEGIEGGADDYLTKPFHPDELRARLRAGRRILDLQHQLISAQEALKIQATHDPLTGLWNRAEIFEIMRREYERAERNNSPLGVVMADLDHFKQINDTQGHLAGDAILHEVASRLVRAVRPYDSVGRYGGEEFLIIMPGCSTESTLRRAERLRVSVSSEPALSGEQNILLTLSLGVAATVETNDSDYHSLVRAADAALYRAKKNGRNRAEAAIPQDSPVLCEAELKAQTLNR